MAIRKTPETKPSKKPLLQRPKPPSIICSRSVRWIFAALKAIASPSLSLKSKRVIKAPIIFAFSLKKHKPYLPIASSMLRPPQGLTGTTKRINAIEKPIVVLVALDFKVLLLPLRSLWLIPRISTTLIANGYQSNMTGIWVKLPITIVTKKTFC